MGTAAYTTNSYHTQEQMAKTIHRSIIKMLHPDNNLGKEITSYEMELFYRANDFYEARDYNALKNIYDVLLRSRVKPKAKSQETISNVTLQATYRTMMEFFQSKGLEVVDKRDKGGCLWVVGNPSEIDNFVKQACRMFNAGGNYAMNGGKASGHRTAWFTHCKR